MTNIHTSNYFFSVVFYEKSGYSYRVVKNRNTHKLSISFFYYSTTEHITCQMLSQMIDIRHQSKKNTWVDNYETRRYCCTVLC